MNGPECGKTVPSGWVLLPHLSNVAAINSAKRPLLCPHPQAHHSTYKVNLPGKSCRGLAWLFVLCRVERGWEKWR